MDLIDRIAEALPVDVRADYYRELRHCRSLPENDEMLRILRIMQFLTLLIHQVPARVTAEREQLDSNLTRCTVALKTIESRLEALPEGVASSLAPEKVAARINESLRQQFVQTTIPQTGEALAVVAEVIKHSVAEFADAAREISGKHRSTATEARHAVAGIDSAIRSAAQTSREATRDLSRALLYLNWTSLVAGGLGLYLFGLVTGFLWFR
jgi:hypothetical protein